MKSDKETGDGAWSKEKKLFVFGPDADFMSLDELEAMNDNGFLVNLIESHKKGQPVSRQDAEYAHKGAFGVLPSVYKVVQWERDHGEGGWEEWDKEQDRKNAIYAAERAERARVWREKLAHAKSVRPDLWNKDLK